MTELKTLKDLDIYNPRYESNHALYVADLKQEAIRWIKELKKYNTLADLLRIEWITNFFNISNEDLK